MKKLLFVFAVAILVVPAYSPVYGQDDSIDITNLLNGAGGGNRGGGNRGPQIPDSKQMGVDIKKILSNGKTPLDNAQVKPLQSLLDTEIITLTDKIQLLRSGNGNNSGNAQGDGGNFPQGGGRGGGRGGRGGGGGGGADQNGQQNNGQPQQTQQQQQAAQAATIETLTVLKNDEFIDAKIQLFLSPEQVALVKKAKADDKNNSTCLGGLLDRVYNQLQSRNNNQNRGNNNNQNFNQNNNNNNSSTRPNGQKYCMATDVTTAQRLEPIRKVLANGKLPMAADKEELAETVMTAQIATLETALRSGLTGNQGGGRGGGNNNNSKINQTIQASTDAIYKKVEASLRPDQAQTLTSWHFTQMLGRSPIESLIAVNAMQDTPLTDEQVAKVTAAWPELQKQIEQAAKAANRKVTDKDRDGAAMNKILEMLDPPQVASYQLAKKYGPQAAAGQK